MYRLFISFRYLRKRPTALFAVIAVTFGVATLLIVLSIMDGYILRLREMIRNQDSHLIIYSPYGLCDMTRIEESLKKIPHIVGIAPSIETAALYRSGKDNPCKVRGIDPTKELEVTQLGKFFFRPEELVELTTLLNQEGDPEEQKERAGKKAKEILADVSRQPLTVDEVNHLFSLSWRKKIIEGLPVNLRDRQLNRPPSAIVVGFQFLSDRNLSVGQTIKIMAIKTMALNSSTSKFVTGNFLVTGAFGQIGRTGGHASLTSRRRS